MKLEDVKERIDEYFENVSDEEFIKPLESSGFVINDDANDCSDKSYSKSGTRNNKTKMIPFFENVIAKELTEYSNNGGAVITDDVINKCSDNPISKQLKNYLDNVTPEQLEKDYEELKDWIKIGPKIVKIDGKLYLELGNNE